MPKNKGRGGKNYRRGKNNIESKRELVFKEEDTEYARVSRMLGGGRIEAECFDGKRRLGEIRGKMRKKVWIQAGDIILVGLRDYQDEKCDVVHKYNGDEIKSLIQFGEVPENTKGNDDDDNDMVDWKKGDSEDEEEDDSQEEDNKQKKKIGETSGNVNQQSRNMPGLSDSDSEENIKQQKKVQPPVKGKKEKQEDINIDDI